MLRKLSVVLAVGAAALAVAGSAGAYLPGDDSGSNVKAGDPCDYNYRYANYALEYGTGRLLICGFGGTWQVVA